MNLKKMLALCLAVLMLLSVAVGCDNTKPVETQPKETQGTNTPKETNPPETTEGSKEIVFPLAEKMEFTGASIMANSYYYKDNIAWNYALDRANIHIELTEFMKDECGEKLNLLLNSGDYPEILYKPAGVDLDSYGMEGILIPLEDLIREYAPNLSAHLDERNAWNELKAPDGHIYSLPTVDISKVGIGTTGPVWINQRWLDNLSLKMPANQEELYNVLKAFKEQDANGNGDPNDEIPFAYPGGTVSIIEGFSLLMEDVLLYGDYFGVTSEGYVYYPATEGFKNDFLAYFAKLYAEGLLDPNSLTQTTDQQSAVSKANDVLGMFQNSGTTNVPEANQTDYLALKSYNKGGYPKKTGVSKNGMAITDKCKNPEVVIAWADWFYTEEGGRAVRLGLEGESYVINSDGSYSYTEGKYESVTYQTTLMGLNKVPGRIPDYYYTGVNPKDNPVTALINKELVNSVTGTTMPVYVLSEEENEAVSTIMADIKPYVENYTAQVISGLISLEDTWDDFQKTLKEMGVDQLITAYTAAYERATG